MDFAALLSSLRTLFAARSPLVALRAIAFALLVAAFGPAAFAEGIDVRTATIEPDDDGWNLEAVFDIQFSQRLEEAVNRGVPLYFVAEFELSRPRWYWFDEKPVVLTQTYKISYTPLLRQYRLSFGNNYQLLPKLSRYWRSSGV